VLGCTATETNSDGTRAFSIFFDYPTAQWFWPYLKGSDDGNSIFITSFKNVKSV
jgi:hypothetical protein